MGKNYNDLLEAHLRTDKYTFCRNNPFFNAILKFLYDCNAIDSKEEISQMITVLNNHESFNKILKKIVECGFLNSIIDRYCFWRGNEWRHLLKYKIIDGHLYIYDLAKSLENQKLLEVSAINGFNVKDILDKFYDLGYNDEQIQILIQHKEVLTNIGFESNKFEIYLPSEEKLLDLSDPNIIIDHDIFYKEHKRSSLLDEGNFSSLIIEEKNPEDVSCSFDGNMKLLKILRGLSKSPDDLKMFDDIIERNRDIIGYKNSDDTNVDWMYISSFFLMNKEENNDLPDYVYSEFDGRLKSINCGKQIVFLDENNEEQSYGYNVDENSFGSNSYIFKNGTFDTRELFHVIRDGLAHSFEVVDDDYVRIYYHDESTSSLTTNFKIKKDIILDFIGKLSEYRSFGNLFPICTLEHPNLSNNNISNLKELESYLAEIFVLDVDIKSYTNLDTLKKNQTDQLLDETKNDEFEKSYNKQFRDYLRYEYDFSKKINDMKYQLDNPMSRLKGDIKHCLINALDGFAVYEYKESKLEGLIGKERMQKIMQKIELISDTFYEQGAYNQHEIITELVRNELNPNRNITSIISDLVKVKDKSSSGNIMDMLNETSCKYINYDKVVKASIIAYLNNIFLYNYQKKSQLSNLDLSMIKIDSDLNNLKVGKQIRINSLLDERYNLYAPIRRKNNHIKHLERSRGKKNITQEELESINSEILLVESQKKEEKERIDNDIKPINDEITSLNEEIRELESGDSRYTYKLKHLRNSLAHGNIRFNDTIDINNIGDLEITFVDYYPRTTEESFRGTIKLRDLLETLNKEDIIRTIFGKKDGRTFK